MSDFRADAAHRARGDGAVIRQATYRLVVAAAATVVGAVVAVVAGKPDAALLVAPWAALVVLGLAVPTGSDPVAKVELAADRLLVGDDVELNVAVAGAAGTVQVRSLPASGFLQSGALRDAPAGPAASEALSAGHGFIALTMPAQRWGTYDVGHVNIELTEPYGLFRREGVAGEPRQVRVHPHPAELHSLLAPWLVRRVAGTHSSKDVGRGVEYADIRPFTSGDSLRDINWRASARSPDLWVSQRHPDRATDVILLLDSFVESGHDVHTVVGLAIEAAVALAESHLAVTDRVGLVDLGGVLRWVTPGTGRLQLQRLVDTLLATGLYANAARRDLEGVPARILPPRSFVVALTPLLDDRFIDALFMLAGRGHDLAVVECAPMALQPRTTASDASRVAHRIWEADRQALRDRLAERGIAVAGWERGGSLEATMRDLTRRRHHTMRVSRR